MRTSRFECLGYCEEVIAIPEALGVIFVMATGTYYGHVIAINGRCWRRGFRMWREAKSWVREKVLKIQQEGSEGRNKNVHSAALCSDCRRPSG